MKDIPGTKYIYRAPGTKEKYGIRKIIDGKIKYFGYVYNLKDALFLRDWCQKNNWQKRYPCVARTLPFKEDYDILKRIADERNVKDSTLETYIRSIIQYTKLLNQSFTSLIELYLIEEETIVWKKRTLKNNLIEYSNYVYKNYLRSTAKLYLSTVLTLLRHLEIEISHLPKVNEKNVRDLPPITHADLLTHEELESCYNIANPFMRAVILFMTSSGCARRETLSLTVQDYLSANNIHVFNKPVKELLLDVDSSIIPTFKIRRQKTNKYYFTYCSPQANTEILNYLQGREDLTLDCPLFDCDSWYWETYFREINTKLKLGTCRNFSRFRSHMLRKFHASTLYNNGMSMEDVDTLQGRGRDSTHRSYFMDDPELLKKKYNDFMDCLLLEV